MKYLAQHERLAHELNTWAGGKKLIVAQFSFWSHGPILQRSLTGLLRSLLYQILKQHRSFVSIAFPDQEWTLSVSNFRFSKDQLNEALNRILETSSSQNVCLFFLIDGLDELNEKENSESPGLEEVTLIRFLRVFRSRAAVKLCVASRPLHRFSREFGYHGESWLAIHDFTHDDISTFVKRSINKSEEFLDLVVNGAAYRDLVEELIEAAQGVFLWVYLACHSLLSGISYQDRISDSQTRLRRLPRELNQLYEHILFKIPQEYRMASARLLLMGSSVNCGTSLLAHTYLDDHERNKLQTSLKMAPSRMRKECTRTQERIAAYCRGFLEIYSEKISLDTPKGFADRGMEFLLLNVRFGHRTTADFVKSKERQRTLFDWADCPSIAAARVAEAYFSALKALLLMSNSLLEPVLGKDGEDLMFCVLQFYFNSHYKLYVRSLGNNADRQHPSYASIRFNLWDEFRDIACQPLQYQSSRSLLHLYTTTRKMFKDHTIYDLKLQGKYAGLALAVCLSSEDFFRYELDRINMGIDTVLDKLYMDFAIKIEDFGIISTFVERGLNLHCVCPPGSQSTWQVILRRIYTTPCSINFERKYWSVAIAALRQLVIVMLQRMPPAEETFHFGFAVWVNNNMQHRVCERVYPVKSKAQGDMAQIQKVHYPALVEYTPQH